MIAERLQQELQKIKQQGLYRIPVPSDSAECINFSANDYLSLRQDPRLQKAFQEGFRQCPVGSGASMLISGYHEIHQQFEQKIAKNLKVDKAILFSSGFAANLSVMSLFAGLKLHVLLDKAVHASIYEGLKLTKAKHTRFLHQDLKSLEQKIKPYAKDQVLVTEGIFSMSGQETHLGRLHSLVAQHQTPLFVDEAHAFGVLGPSGLGAVAAYGLSQEEVPLRMLSFGKAMGAQGAVVAGKSQWMEALLQFAKPYIYSTGMSPALTYGLDKAFDLLLGADDKRAKLRQLIQYFREKTQNSSLNWRDSTSAIQQLQLGCPHKALHFAACLQGQGIHCLAIRAPTVNRLETGLRVVINSHHEMTDIDKLFHAIIRIAD